MRCSGVLTPPGSGEVAAHGPAWMWRRPKKSIGSLRSFRASRSATWRCCFRMAYSPCVERRSSKPTLGIAIDKLAGANEDQTTGIKILARAIEEPLRQIMTNAGEDTAVVLNRVREGKGTFGYNAATGEYGDLVEMGILDPTKVTRLALQNASSVAGLLLTTEVMVAESPKDEEHAHGAPGGGMGGMGGMDM